MTILHQSISANHPQVVATFLANIMGGIAMLFPPFPNCWIAFTAEDDGTAIEVYPTTHVLEVGPHQLSCEIVQPDISSTFAHTAICSQLSAVAIMALSSTKGWTSRLCNRGPFECIEFGWKTGFL